MPKPRRQPAICEFGNFINLSLPSAIFETLCCIVTTYSDSAVIHSRVSLAQPQKSQVTQDVFFFFFFSGSDITK